MEVYVGLRGSRGLCTEEVVFHGKGSTDHTVGSDTYSLDWDRVVVGTARLGSGEL